MTKSLDVIAGTDGCVKFGALLKTLRHYNNLGAKDIASYAKVSVSLVSMIENGQRAPTKDTVREFLSCMKDQGRWSPDGNTLFLIDPVSENEMVFTFHQESKNSKKQQTVATVLVRNEHIRLESIKIAYDPKLRIEDSISIAKRIEQYVKSEDEDD